MAVEKGVPVSEVSILDISACRIVLRNFYESLAFAQKETCFSNSKLKANHNKSVFVHFMFSGTDIFDH